MTLTLPSLFDRMADEEAKRLAELKKNAHPGAYDCDVCGVVGAGCLGFGCFIGVRGIWSCSDKDCLAEAKSRASGQCNLIAAE